MIRTIRKDQAPALGDIRDLGRGDTIVVTHDANQRKDWGRFASAIADAVTQGADVRQLLGRPSE
jgi:hypothetical protein